MIGVQALLDRYFELLPQYQGVPLEALRFRRVLFGAFPTYAASPLRPQFDRILQVPSPPACSCPLPHTPYSRHALWLMAFHGTRWLSEP